MHKSFYASGFLYNLKTHQILLLQIPDTEQISLWSILSSEIVRDETAQNAFQRIIQNTFNLELNPKSIYPIYDYYDPQAGKRNDIFYAELTHKQATTLTIPSSMSWMNFNELSKLLFYPHTKQDIIVGERVINLKYRLSMKLQ